MSKKEGLALLLIMLAASAFPVSAEKTVFSGWVYSGDTFEKENNIYYVSYFEYGRFDFERNRVMLKENDVGMVLKLDKDPDNLLCTKWGEEGTAIEGECLTKATKQDTYCVFKDLRKYCLMSIDYSDARVKYSGGKEYPGIQIKIADFTPALKATAKLEPATLTKYGEASIIFELSNTGDERLAGINFEYTIPVEAQILSHSNLERSGRTFAWTGNLMPGARQTLRIRFKLLDYSSETSKALITYSFRGADFELSPSVAFKTITPYAFGDALSPAKDVIEQLTTYTLTFENKEAKDYMSVHSRTTLPWGLDIVTKTLSWKQEEDYLVYDDRLAPGQKRSISVQLRGHYTGEYPIETSAELNVKDEDFYLESSKTYHIINRKLTPEIRASPNKVESGDPIAIKALLFNNNKDENYINIRGTIYCELFDAPHSVSVDEIIVDNNKLVLDKEIITPITNKQSTVEVLFEGTYQLASGEQHEFSTTKSFIITPVVGERFVIFQEPEQTTVQKGEELTVRVFVENLKPLKVGNVNVRDQLPQGISAVGGTTRTSTGFDDLQKKRAYVYRVLVPADYPGSEFEIKTLLDYQEYDLEATTIITLTEPITGPDEPDQTDEPDEPDQTDEPDEQPPEPEKSFWQKIKDFFSKLF